MGDESSNRKRRRLAWDVAPPQQTQDYGEIRHVGSVRNGSPPKREDDRDGHYLFTLGENLTPRYMHDLQLIHTDLKPENILLVSSDFLKLPGYKRISSDETQFRCLPKSSAIKLIDSDIINELVKSGKEIEAVYFASESGLTEQFSPVSLLKSCLKNCRKSANSVSKSGNYISAAEEANNSELIATRAILKCIEDHKLESQFSIESLKKRVTQLERVKADKKKSVAPFTSKPSNKRTRGGNSRGGGGGPSSRPPKAGRFSNNSPAFRQRNPPQSRQIPPARFATQYNSPSRTMYDRPSTPSYLAKYGGALAQSPVTVPPPYPYAPPDVEVVGTRAAASYLGQGPYGGSSIYPAAYDYSAGHPTYPTSYPASYPASYPG